MIIPDHFTESLETVFWVKNTSLTRILIRDLIDPGSRIRVGKVHIWDWDKHPRSVTVLITNGSTGSAFQTLSPPIWHKVRNGAF
jgi:hypothetical protein